MIEDQDVEPSVWEILLDAVLRAWERDRSTTAGLVLAIGMSLACNLLDGARILAGLLTGVRIE